MAQGTSKKIVKRIEEALPVGNNNIGDVDVASSALPTGASTSAKQDTGNTTLASIDGKITEVNTGAVTISSSALPTGAATAAKQPALGTAGSASTDVITVQGIASGTAQPVSGTITANAGTGTFTVDSELPAAAALSDNIANPTTTSVGSFELHYDGTTWDRVQARVPSADALDPSQLAQQGQAVRGLSYLFNGTNWDRTRGDITNGLDVDVTRLPALPAGTNNIGDGWPPGDNF